jgi:hypothetical protein
VKDVDGNGDGGHILMSRSKFILSLLGLGFVAKGQNTILVPAPPTKVPNNQCPVCWTVAPVYTQPTYLSLSDCHLDSNGKDTLCSGMGTAYGPTSQMIRCAKCNVAFWQDATPPQG